MLRARFDPPELIGGPCVDCGERDMVLTAGVYDDEEPYAMVLAIFSRPGDNQAASLRVTLAEPGADGPAPRETFAFKLGFVARPSPVRDDVLQVFYCGSFVDNSDGDFPADDEGPAVRCLSRAEALAHARRQEVFAAIDCAVKALLRPILARPMLH